jgi:hypothetical protein
MSEVIRRPMAAALRTGDLSPAMLEFVKAGTPARVIAAPVARVESEKVEQPIQNPKSDEDGSEQKTKTFRPSKGLQDQAPERVEPVSKVTLSIRVPMDIPASLLRVSTDRKLNHQQPATQQEIVTEAIYQWLKRNGY